MKAAIYSPIGQIKITNMPVPELGNRCGAIIKVTGCGLCGSDIVKIQRDLVSEGTVLGHEVVGIIKEINTLVNTHFKVNDRVVIAHHVPCGKCRYCIQKSFSMCETFKKSYFEPGGFAEYMYISKDHLLKTTYKIPDTVDDIQASFMEPVACILRALDRADIQPEQNVLVVGLGFIGLLFVQLLTHKNVNILCCDLIDERIELARKFGAHYSFKSDNLEGNLKHINEYVNFKGVDVVILASGANSTIDLAVKSVRDGGKIIIFASIPDNNLGFYNNDIYYRELLVTGAYSSSPEHLAQSMQLIEQNKINLESFCDSVDIEQINQAIQDIVDHKTLKVYLKL